MPKTHVEALSDDTAVTGGGGRYTAEVNLRWDNRGSPLSAILAGSMIRAATLGLGMHSVVSSTTQFLHPLQVGTVDISCEIVGGSSALCCVGTVAMQGGRTVSQGATWLSSRSAKPSYVQASPAVPDWTDLQTAEERLGPGLVTYSDVLEQRPLIWEGDFENRREGLPYRLSWARFPPGSKVRDQVTMACEVLVLGDLCPPLTMILASPQRAPSALSAQTFELSAHMGSFEDNSEYLLVETLCESMSDQMLTGLVRVWSENRAFRGYVSAAYRLPPPNS